MKSKPFGVLFGLLALVAILAIAPSAFAESVKVTIPVGAATCDSTKADTCYSPSTITIAPGTTVEWINADKMSHTVTSGKLTDNETGTLFDSGEIKKGKTWDYTFTKEGTYDYLCTYHIGTMAGKVIVAAAASTTPTANATVPEFGPVTSIVLAIAVLSMVVFAAKTRVIPRL